MKLYKRKKNQLLFILVNKEFVKILYLYLANKINLEKLLIE